MPHFDLPETNKAVGPTGDSLLFTVGFLATHVMTRQEDQRA